MVVEARSGGWRGEEARVWTGACVRCGRCCHACSDCYCGDLCPACRGDVARGASRPAVGRADVLGRLCRSCLGVIAGFAGAREDDREAARRLLDAET